MEKILYFPNRCLLTENFHRKEKYYTKENCLDREGSAVLIHVNFFSQLDLGDPLKSTQSANNCNGLLVSQVGEHYCLRQTTHFNLEPILLTCSVTCVLLFCNLIDLFTVLVFLNRAHKCTKFLKFLPILDI